MDLFRESLKALRQWDTHSTSSLLHIITSYCNYKPKTQMGGCEKHPLRNHREPETAIIPQAPRTIACTTARCDLHFLHHSQLLLKNVCKKLRDILLPAFCIREYEWDAIHLPGIPFGCLVHQSPSPQIFHSPPCCNPWPPWAWGQLYSGTDHHVILIICFIVQEMSG